ncbi:MAG: integrase core domain-containing protein [Actinomycetota bacterium]
MNKKSNEPVDSRVRLAISRWPDDAPRGAVSTFCAEHGLSRKTFYAIRARVKEEGPAAVLEPRSRRPRSSPTRMGEEVKEQAVQVRAALEASGLDHGPISVFDKMRAMGLQPPSVATLARIFRERGVARLEPKKRPRAAYRRFVYPAPNACWQLDATEYVLTQGRTCVIFQLQDDHSRLAVASHVAAGETSEGALTVFRKGVSARGVPQRLLTDNGMALNPSRRGWQGQLVTYAASLGVTAMTGKPYKPTTQGKNERFHQTLFRFLDKQPLAESIAALQAQVDRFDEIYNTQRPHQGLPGRITPHQAWHATVPAEPPRPAPAPVQPVIPLPAATLPEPTGTPAAPAPRGTRLADGHRQLTIYANGTVNIKGVSFLISHPLAGHTIHAIWDPHGVIFADLDGQILAEHPWPAKNITYVSHHAQTDPTRNRGGRPRKNPVPPPEPSPMS